MLEDDDCVCVCCGQEYALLTGCVPTKYCNPCAQELVVELLAACKAALYLLGNDSDRKAIGDRPWLPRDATSVPSILREAIAKSEGGAK